MKLNFVLMCLFMVTTKSDSDYKNAFEFDSFFPKGCESVNIEVECKSCNKSVQSYMLYKRAVTDGASSATGIFSTKFKAAVDDVPSSTTEISQTKPESDINDDDPSATEMPPTKPDEDNITDDPSIAAKTFSTKPETDVTDVPSSSTELSPGKSEADVTDVPSSATEVSPRKPEAGIAESNHTSDKNTVLSSTATPHADPTNDTILYLKNGKNEAGALSGEHKHVKISKATSVALVVFICLCGSVGAFLLANFVVKKVSDRYQSGTYDVPGQTNAPI